MSSFTQRIKENYGKRKGIKAISPVIATIILIAVALILALIVGVFAFGLFSSHAKAVTLASGNLSGGKFTMSFQNPGSSGVGVTTVTLSGPGTLGTCTPSPSGIPAGGSLTSTCTVTGVGAGNDYDYVIQLNNSQSISGVVVAT